MPPLSSSIRFSQAEDGEAVGTLRQFSERLHRPPSQIVPCLRKNADQPIILQAGRGPEQLLILDTSGAEALQECAEAPPATA